MGSEIKVKEFSDFRKKINETAPARERLASLFDSGSFVEVDAFVAEYNQTCGVVTGYGYIQGSPAYAFSQDVTVLSGAVTQAHAQKIKKMYDLAAKTGTPVVGVYDSNGAKLTEGIDVLGAYGEIMHASNNLSGVVPQIALVLGTCAGTSAMLACCADVVIMSEKAEFFLNSPFTASAKREKNAALAGTAAAAAKSGAIHIVAADDSAAIDSAREVIGLLPSNNLVEAPLIEYTENNTVLSESSSAKDIINAVADTDSVIELQEEFAPCVATAFATVAGGTVGMVATNKEIALNASGANKAARFVRLCDAFNVPVITFVDTLGFEDSLESELAGGIREMSKLAHAYAEATTAKISVVTGEAYGPAYVMLAGKSCNADIAVAWASASISALKPDTSVELMWHDKLVGAEDLTSARNELIEEYKNTLASPLTAAAGGHLDNVIEPAETRNTIICSLDMLAGKRVSKMPKKHGNMPL